MEKKNRGLSFFLKRVLAGIFIGIGGILPGISGGIMCVSMGLYEPIIDALSTLFKDFKNNILFLLPIGLGGIIGAILTSRLIGLLMDGYEMALMYALVGLIASGIPSLIREANRNGFKLRYIIMTALGLLMIFALSALEAALEGNIGLTLDIKYAMLAGAIIAVGCLVPGLSTAALLMSLNIYDPLVVAVNRFDFSVLAFVGLGGLIVAVLLIKLIGSIFKRFHGYAYYFVLGLLISSIFCAGKNLTFSLSAEQIIYTLLLIAGLFGGVYMDKKMDSIKV